MLNLYCLFHKCGNKYVANAHRQYRGSSVDFVPDVVPEQAGSVPSFDQANRAINVRCRNFGFDDLNDNGLLDMPDVRFLVFTRHPASFILSAVKYHLRGTERWAQSELLSRIGDVPLTPALQGARNAAEQQIIAIRQFLGIYERQASLVPLFDDERVMRVTCEELFTTTSDDFFQGVAEFLRVGHSRRFVQALKNASPAYKADLPKHSTGAFRLTNPYSLLEPEAQAEYDKEFRGIEKVLGYG
ncbi:hypothetical protein RXV86_17430 [Alisedimentitalea sp. MJ-SS2]|uniref:hypothetical protein n=1 Tax=Aliisedimentitalea sp. MJ-SS2 TaxID=3049795 RepID=UPI0029071AF1|nr:hypothetical protein [Alisedimentitalea sp. MJ-SS2]MDU8929179.1 hypothetical protein [Alisedimentitalea sp. MJ-SS2]